MRPRHFLRMGVARDAGSSRACLLPACPVPLSHHVREHPRHPAELESESLDAAVGRVVFLFYSQHLVHLSKPSDVVDGLAECDLSQAQPQMVALAIFGSRR